MSINRRKFLTTGLGAAATVGTMSVPSIVKAESKKTYKFKMTCAYPGGAPFYSTGPGSAKDFIKRVETMSGGRIKIKFYAADRKSTRLNSSHQIISYAVFCLKKKKKTKKKKKKKKKMNNTHQNIMK